MEFVDKDTHEPCPTHANRLCTITDADHLHIAAHMVPGRSSGLTILGAHGNDVWVETDGELTCLTRADLREALYQLEVCDLYDVAGVLLDESDAVSLIRALDGPQLDDCAWCEQPGLIDIEGRMVCPGHANGYGFAEQESEGCPDGFQA